jgi:hypothetical protein
MGIRSEEFDDGCEVYGLILSIDCGALRASIGEELFGLCFGDEYHWSVPCVGGPRRSGHPIPGPRGSAAVTALMTDARKLIE